MDAPRVISYGRPVSEGEGDIDRHEPLAGDCLRKRAEGGEQQGSGRDQSTYAFHFSFLIAGELG